MWNYDILRSGLSWKRCTGFYQNHTNLQWWHQSSLNLFAVQIWWLQFLQPWIYSFFRKSHNSTVMTSSSTAWKVNQKIRTRKSSNTVTRHLVSIFYISLTLIGLLSFPKFRLSPCLNEVIAFSQIHVTLHEWRVIISLQINLNLYLLPTLFS